MSEMINRVASAIGEAMTDKDGWLKKAYSTDDLFEIARVAIKAMREPTAAMVQAGDDVDDIYSETKAGACEHYQAMIEAGLK